MAEQKIYANILDQMLDDNTFEHLASVDDAEFFGHQTAGGASSGAFSWNQDTGKVEEGTLPEVAEAASLQEDHTGIERPKTETPSQVVASQIVPSQENWHSRRATESSEDNDSVLNDALLDFNQAEKGAPLEKKELSDADVKSKIDGWFKEAKTPRQIIARLQRLAEQELYNKSFATNYLKTEAGKMGYSFMEPNAFMDKAPQSTMNTFETVKIKGSLETIRPSKSATKIPLKQAAADNLLESTSLHRTQATESQVGGLPIVHEKAAQFSSKIVEKMFAQGANLETIFHTGRAKVGSKIAADAVKGYLASLRKSKTAKVALSQLDCTFLKGKLAAHNAIIGASKCASCSFRQGMACGLTGGTLISFPGMQAGVNPNQKTASGAPKDGRAMINEFDLHEATPAADIDISEPNRMDVDGSAAKLDI